MKTSRITALIATVLLLSANAFALDHPGMVVPSLKEGNFTLIEKGVPPSIIYDESDYEGVKIAVRNLRRPESAPGLRACMRNDAAVWHHGRIQT